MPLTPEEEKKLQELEAEFGGLTQAENDELASLEAEFASLEPASSIPPKVSLREQMPAGGLMGAESIGQWNPSIGERLKEGAKDLFGIPTGAVGRFGQRAAQPLESELLPIAGSVAGSIAGGVPGAIVGGTLGEAGREAVRTLSGSPDAPISKYDLVKDSVMRGITEGAFDWLGGKVGAAIIGKGSNAAKEVTKRLSGVVDNLPISFGKDRALIPAGGKLLDKIAILSRRSGAEYSEKIAKEVAVASDGIIDDILKSTSTLDVEDAGKYLLEQRGVASRAFQDTADTMYEFAYDLLGEGATIDTKAIKAMAMSLLEQDVKGGKQLLDPVARQMLEGLSGVDDAIDFSIARGVKSSLLSKIREGTAAGQQKAYVSTYKQIAETLQKAISEPRVAGPIRLEGIEAIKRADKFYRNKEAFKQQVARAIAKQGEDSPEKLVPFIFKKNGIVKVSEAKELITKRAFSELEGGVPVAGRKATKEGIQAWNNVRRAHINNIIDVATDAETGLISRKRLMTEWRKPGKQALNEAFDPGEQKAIEELFDVMSIASDRAISAGSGTGEYLPIRILWKTIGLAGIGIPDAINFSLKNNTMGTAKLAKGFTKALEVYLDPKSTKPQLKAANAWLHKQYESSQREDSRRKLETRRKEAKSEIASKLGNLRDQGKLMTESR